MRACPARVALALSLLAVAAPAAERAPARAAEVPPPLAASSLRPAGDLDGDGRTDLADVQVVPAHRLQGAQVPQRQGVVVRRGRDGAVLWDRQLPAGPDVRVAFTTVGAQGRPGMLVLWSDGSAASLLTVAAYDAAGEPLWTRTVAGSVAGGTPDVPFVLPAGTVAAVAGDRVAGTGRLVPGGGTDVLVVTEAGASSWRAPQPGAYVSRLAVIDGADGTLRGLGQPLAGSAPLHATVGPDLDGDRADDVLAVTWELGRPLLRAVSSAGGEVLWSYATTRDEDDAQPIALPDVTGDGAPDVALLVGFDVASGTSVDATVTLLDGTSGAPVWTRPGTGAIAVGDVDGRRGSELVLPDTSNAARRAAAYDAKGRTVWSAGPRTAVDRYASYRPVGDVQGDGVAEVGFVHDDGDGPYPYYEAVLDGRTGRRLHAESKALRVLDGAVDGRGADVATASVSGRDLAVSAYRGNGGGRLWDVALRLPGVPEGRAVAFAAPLDGDRCADVVVTVGAYGWSVTAVLSGATGRPLWVLENTPDHEVATRPKPLSRRLYASGC